MSVVSGKSVLRKFLQSKHGSLSKAPVIIVSSAPPQDYTFKDGVFSVDTACRKIQFYTGIEMGLSTIESHVTSVFPTVEHVQSTLQLCKRMGACTIIGVGSGAAMDLTKALVENSGSDMTGILVPCTYGAIMAATSSQPLLLDTREEALIVSESSTNDGAGGDSNNTVVVETDSLANVYRNDAVFACLALGVDAMYRGRQDDDGTNLLQLATQSLTDDSKLPDALVKGGNIMSFGIHGTSIRSSPLALAASLIPPSFPNVPILTFMASLLPGIVQVMGNDNDLYNNVEEFTDDIPSLASLMVHADGAQSVSALMSHVKANQALWKCIDVQDDALEAILHYSLNR